MIAAVTEWLSSAGSGPSSDRPTLRYRQEPDFMDAKVFLTTDVDYRPQYRQTLELTDGAKTYYLAVQYY